MPCGHPTTSTATSTPGRVLVTCPTCHTTMYELRYTPT